MTISTERKPAIPLGSLTPLGSPENPHTGNATSSAGPPSPASSLRFRLPNFRGSFNIEFDA